jgi:hypothetical protein
MKKIIRKVIQKRPSLNVDFYKHSQEVINLINEYADKGETPKYKTYMSDDGLSYTIETTFKNLDYYYALGNEPLILDAVDKRQSYCQIKNINFTIEEINEN